MRPASTLSWVSQAWGGMPGPARGAEWGAAKMLCYFSFRLMKVRRSIAVTTPNTICFVKELPFPLTVSTENTSLVKQKQIKNNHQTTKNKQKTQNQTKTKMKQKATSKQANKHPPHSQLCRSCYSFIKIKH